jgi:hypothetical protein
MRRKSHRSFLMNYLKSYRLNYRRSCLMSYRMRNHWNFH